MPLIGLTEVLKNPEAQIIITQASAQHAAAIGLLYPRLIPVFSSGEGTDWSALNNRSIVLWPINDVDSFNAMARLGADIPSESIKIINVNDEVPEYWGLHEASQEKLSVDVLIDYAKRHAVAWTPDLLKVSEELPPVVQDYPTPSFGGANNNDDLIDALRTVVQPLTEAIVKKIPTPRKPRLIQGNITSLHGDPISSGSATDYRTQLIMDENGNPKPKLFNNIVAFLSGHPEMHSVMAWNDFATDVFIIKKPPWITESAWFPSRMRETDIGECRKWLERCGLTPSKSDACDAIKQAAMSAMYNPVRDYMERLQWDGVDRLSHLGAEFMGAPADPIYAIFITKWFISAVARVKRPGEQVDAVLVLESPQGRRKSSFFRAIATLDDVPYFYDDPGDITKKDSIINLHGKLIVEVSEMTSFKKSDVASSNAWVTRRVDIYRPLFERQSRDVPRQFVIGGSVNPSGYGYLKDPTGARRYWPVPVNYIDVDSISTMRDQLWAEAVYLYNQGVKWWLNPEEEIEHAKIVRQRFAEDPWKYKIEILLRGRQRVTVSEVMTDLGIMVQHQSEYTLKRITEILAGYGYLKSEGGDWVVYKL